MLMVLSCSVQECKTISHDLHYRYVKSHYRFGFCAQYDTTQSVTLEFLCANKADFCHTCVPPPPPPSDMEFETDYLPGSVLHVLQYIYQIFS